MTIEKTSHLVWQVRVARVMKVFPAEGLSPKAFQALVMSTLETKDTDLAQNTMAACVELGVLECIRIGKGATAKHLWRVPTGDATSSTNPHQQMVL